MPDEPTASTADPEARPAAAVRGGAPARGPRAAPPPDDGAGGPDEPAPAHPFVRAGRFAWAALGLLALLALAGFVLAQVSLVVVPLVLALFPAALLAPPAGWLKRRGVPPALASLLTIVGGLLLLAGMVAVLVGMVAAELPDLIESAAEGLDQLEALLQDGLLGVQLDGFGELLTWAQAQLGEADALVGQALTAAGAVVEGVVGVLFGLVALFFYLKDDSRLAAGVRDLLPQSVRRHANELGPRVWGTVGAYFRGQLLVALVDAVFIGIGLLILGVPLAIPLAVVVFFGGLFPIVGAFVSGALAVLVALADTGWVTALIVLALIVAVQQLESNVLEPVVLSHVIALHPLVVLSSLTVGGVLFGILGAFLAVPVAASVARVIDYLRMRRLAPA